MRPKLYVETSIVGYLASRPSRDVLTASHQKLTEKWWKNRRSDFELFCSEPVMVEAATGDEKEAAKRLSLLDGLTVLELSTNALALAEKLLKRKALPARAEIDAYHLAIAAVNKLNYLLTWNCRHLANASMQKIIERVCKKAGYDCPVICTPEQLTEGP